MRARAATLAAALVLAACQDRAPPAPPPEQAAAPTPAPDPPPFEGTAPPPAPVVSPEMVPEAERGEKGARGVLLAWARALERGDYDTAFAQWGEEAEARSGMTRAEHAAWWRRFKTVTVAMPTGTLEGAAGSSYYTAPTTVIGKQQNGKPYRLEGTVALRRVNDVPGASADQLRWHIEKVDLQPVS